MVPHGHFTTWWLVTSVLFLSSIAKHFSSGVWFSSPLEWCQEKCYIRLVSAPPVTTICAWGHVTEGRQPQFHHQLISAGATSTDLVPGVQPDVTWIGLGEWFMMSRRWVGAEIRKHQRRTCYIAWNNYLEMLVMNLSSGLLQSGHRQTARDEIILSLLIFTHIFP